MKNHFIWLCLFLMLSSCVSVQVPFGPVPKSDKATVVKPDAPFVDFATSTADEAWMSEKTGNTISYLSECKRIDDKIEDVALDSVKAIDQSHVLKKSNGFIGSNVSSEVLMNGKVDNHKVKMSIVVFKSGDCTFSLTYGGLEQHFDSEYKYFEDFKKGFRIP